MKLTGYQARMQFRKFRIPVPEDFISGDTEQVYQFDTGQQFYVAIVTDYSARCPALLASPTTAEINIPTSKPPETTFRQNIDLLRGLHSYQINTIASEMDFPHEHWQTLVDMVMKLYECYIRLDCELVEMNPLVITTQGRLLAASGRIIVDENALYRRPDLADIRATDEETPLERMAREAGLAGVTMGGQAGCLVNGAGLAMTTMDLIEHFGAADGVHAANFVEIDSSASPEQIAGALRIILSDSNVKVILVNIFGGLTRCDDVAAGVVLAFRSVENTVPVVVRLQGTNAPEGQRIIANARLPGIISAETLSEAAWKVVAVVKGIQPDVNPD